MRVLLISPDRSVAQICGDDIVTRLLRDHPPPGVAYTHFSEGLRAGWLTRGHPARAWAASLVMHSRPPAGVAYTWGPLPPLPFRVLGRLLPDRPDEDVQWLRLADPGHFDLVHAWAYPLHLEPRRGRPPVVLHCGTGNSDLLLNYYGLDPALATRLATRDRRLLRALGVLHDLYSTDGAAAVVVPSRYAWDLHVAAGVPEQRLRLVRLGFEDPVPAGQADLREPATCRFTLVGHQFWRKGGRALVAAFDRLRRLHPEARLTIVSAVRPDELGVPSDGITIFPGLPRETIYSQIYPATDVYMLPSLAEGYGMSVVEAMSFGLPVIASRISALPELVEDGATGLLTPPDDADALFQAMKRLLEDAALRRRMGAASRARFLAEHVVDVTNQALLEVYLEALSR